MANLFNKFSMLFSFKQIINLVFIIVPLIIIVFSLFNIIKYFKKDELFILFVVRVLVCLFFMMIPVLYNSSKLLYHNHKVIEKTNEEYAFNFEKIKNEDSDLKKLYIGDSRTVGMYYAMYGGSGNYISVDNGQETWYAKVSAGYNWFINDALHQVNNHLVGGNYELVFLMGANDLYNSKLATNYINIIKEYAEQYPNSKFIIVSVNPINDELSLNHGYSSTNQMVIDFNYTLEEAINDTRLDNISYCDTYKNILNEYETNDGLHYNANTYKKIFNLINSCL